MKRVLILVTIFSAILTTTDTISAEGDRFYYLDLQNNEEKLRKNLKLFELFVNDIATKGRNKNTMTDADVKITCAEYRLLLDYLEARDYPKDFINGIRRTIDRFERFPCAMGNIPILASFNGFLITSSRYKDDQQFKNRVDVLTKRTTNQFLECAVWGDYAIGEFFSTSAPVLKKHQNELRKEKDQKNR